MKHFFAIEVPQAVREEIAEQVDRWRDLLGVSHAYRWVVPLDYHLTLLFLGNISEVERERAIQEALPVAKATAPFVVTLAPPGIFRKDRISALVLWLGVRHSEPLMDTASRLRVSVAQTDVLASQFPAKPDLREQSYKPHITLGRGAFPPEHYGAKLRYERAFPYFTVDHFVLMETLPVGTRQNGSPVRYNIVQTFPLGDAHSSPTSGHRENDLG